MLLWFQMPIKIAFCSFAGENLVAYLTVVHGPSHIPFVFSALLVSFPVALHNILLAIFTGVPHHPRGKVLVAVFLRNPSSTVHIASVSYNLGVGWQCFTTLGTIIQLPHVRFNGRVDVINRLHLSARLETNLHKGPALPFEHILLVIISRFFCFFRRKRVRYHYSFIVQIF